MTKENQPQIISEAESPEAQDVASPATQPDVAQIGKVGLQQPESAPNGSLDAKPPKKLTGKESRPTSPITAPTIDMAGSLQRVREVKDMLPKLPLIGRGSKSKPKPKK